MVPSSKIKKTLSKLRQPLDIEYISTSLLEVSKSEAEKILNELVEDGILDKKNNEYSVKSKK
jgi:predicted transcriptional regulator